MYFINEEDMNEDMGDIEDIFATENIRKFVGDEEDDSDDEDSEDEDDEWEEDDL